MGGKDHTDDHRAAEQGHGQAAVEAETAEDEAIRTRTGPEGSLNWGMCMLGISGGMNVQ